MFLAILMSGSPARPSGSICRRCIAWHLSDRHHRSELFQRSSLDDQIAFRGFEISMGFGMDADSDI